MEKTASTHRVLMAKRVADKWLSVHSSPEYRLVVYRLAAREPRHLPSLLRSFRDGKIKIGSASSISDLGIKAEFDSITLRSRDQEALGRLEQALQKLGCETSGVY